MSLDLDAIAEEDRAVNYSQLNDGNFHQYYEGRSDDEHYLENRLPHNPYDPMIGGGEPASNIGFGASPGLSPAYSPTDADLGSQAYVTHGDSCIPT